MNKNKKNTHKKKQKKKKSNEKKPRGRAYETPVRSAVQMKHGHDEIGTGT